MIRGRYLRGILVVLVAIIAALFASPLLVDDSEPGWRNLYVIALINSNVIILVLVATLILRNVIRLLLDRRRGIIGSRLRLRLVTAFVGLSLAPVIVLFLFASGIVTDALDGWFSNHVDSAVRSAVSVGRMYDRLIEREVRREVSELARMIPNIRRGNLLSVIERERVERGLFSIRLVRFDGSTVLMAAHPTVDLEGFAEPELDGESIRKAVVGESIIRLEEREEAQFFRGYRGLPRAESDERMILVVTSRISPDLTRALSDINDSYDKYEVLKRSRGSLKSGYLLTLSLITALLLFGAVWLGFFIARELTVPIQSLADGTRELAKGNLKARVGVDGDDELSTLAENFNTMASEIEEKQAEIESRRSYLEAMIENLSVGVVSVDKEGVITIGNTFADRVLESNVSSARGVRIVERVPPHFGSIITRLTTRLGESGAAGYQGEALRESYAGTRHGMNVRLVFSAIGVRDGSGGRIGSVFVIEDITELASVNQAEAWREVARRIAHEIKNPLMPLQLSAERLQKILAGAQEEKLVTECVATIVQYVDSIKRLANELSHFAFLPRSERRPVHLNDLVAEVVHQFSLRSHAVTVHCLLDPKVEEVPLDGEQIRRVLFNLLDNAVGAIEAGGAASHAGRVVLRTVRKPSNDGVLLEVVDNGPGIPEAQRQRIFDPYFTTKPDGTGLGLAIVLSIIRDHGGTIRVLPEEPHGARFSIEMPLG